MSERARDHPTFLRRLLTLDVIPRLPIYYYNLCWIPRTMRVTPAMAMGVAKHPWDLAEFLDALLSVGPVAPPVVQALTPRRPETTSRELPPGRGFLRSVPGGGSAASASSPETPPAAPAAPVAPAEPSADAGQLDLLSWRPAQAAEPTTPPRKPAKLLPKGTQLSLLFGIELEPDPEPDPTK